MVIAASHYSTSANYNSKYEVNCTETLYLLTVGKHILFYSVAQLFPIWATGSAFSWLPCPFERPYYRVFTPLFVSASRHCQQLLAQRVSCPNPRTSHLPKEPWFLSIGEWPLEAKMWTLGDLCLLMSNT